MFIIYVYVIVLYSTLYPCILSGLVLSCVCVFCMTTHLTSKEKIQNPTLVLL